MRSIRNGAREKPRFRFDFYQKVGVIWGYFISSFECKIWWFNLIIKPKHILLRNIWFIPYEVDCNIFSLWILKKLQSTRNPIYIQSHFSREMRFHDKWTAGHKKVGEITFYLYSNTNLDIPLVRSWFSWYLFYWPVLIINQPAVTENGNVNFVFRVPWTLNLVSTSTLHRDAGLVTIAGTATSKGRLHGVASTGL